MKRIAMIALQDIPIYQVKAGDAFSVGVVRAKIAERKGQARKATEDDVSGPVVPTRTPAPEHPPTEYRTRDIQPEAAKRRR